MAVQGGQPDSGDEGRDLRPVPRPKLLNMLLHLRVIRAFEQALLSLKGQGLVHGPVHTSCGQEAVAVGAAAALGRDDRIASTHRAHHHVLAKMLAYYAPADFDPLAGQLTDPMQECVSRLMAEVMGLSAGYGGGRGGSMHLSNPEAGVLGTSAIVGGGVPVATGAAWALKARAEDAVVACFFGDGALGQGCVYEAINMASTWQLPIVYVIENNHYAVATSVEEAFGREEVSAILRGFRVRVSVADGMDPVEVESAINNAAEPAREGHGPAVVEVQTYRVFHHAGDLPGSAYGYRDKAEEEYWNARDPLAAFPRLMAGQGLLSPDEDEALRRSADGAVERAVDFCTEAQGEKKRRVRAALVPEASTVLRGVRSDGAEFAGVRFVEREDFDDLVPVKYVEAIATVTGRWLEQDRGVFVMGEEVGHLGGGAYQATRGLPQAYPGRVVSTPISEAGFVGIGTGAALSGMRPIIEIMFPDFALVAADQLFNHAGQLRYMYGGEAALPLVVRTRIATGCGYGAQHSMDPVGLYSLFPGWQIFAPSDAFDYVGLFNSAMLSRHPVLMVEHHSLYGEEGEVPRVDLSYFIRPGRARVVAEGGDVTVVAYQAMMREALAAARELGEEGIGVEVIDLRSLDSASLDMETIAASVRKTGALVTLEESPLSRCIGPRIAQRVQEECFDSLDCPIRCIGGADVPMPVSKVLESAALPDSGRVRDVLRRAARREL